MKDRLLLGTAGFPVTIGHRELIKVRQQSQRRSVDLVEFSHSSAPVSCHVHLV